MRTSKITQREKDLGKRIRRFRHRKGLTQEELAERVGVSVTHIGLVETGYRGISMKTLQKVARVLGVKGNELLPF